MPRLKIVFVSSEGTGLKALERSESAVMRATFLEMRDLSTEQAIEFVKSKCRDKVAKIGLDEVERVIKEVTGGRCSLLMKLCNSINNGHSLSSKLHSKFIFAVITVTFLYISFYN